MDFHFVLAIKNLPTLSALKLLILAIELYDPRFGPVPPLT